MDISYTNILRRFNKGFTNIVEQIRKFVLGHGVPPIHKRKLYSFDSGLPILNEVSNVLLSLSQTRCVVQTTEDYVTREIMDPGV